MFWSSTNLSVSITAASKRGESLDNPIIKPHYQDGAPGDWRLCDNLRATKTLFFVLAQDLAGRWTHKMHALAHGAGHYLIDIVVRCLFGGVALNAKAGIRATVEKRGHRCFIGPRRLSRLIQIKSLLL